VGHYARIFWKNKLDINKDIAIRFKSNDGHITDPNQIVFPILKDNGSSWELVGTGFFVSKVGLFFTAKHVLQERGGSNFDQGLFALNFSRIMEPMLSKLEQICWHNAYDAALGIVSEQDSVSEVWDETNPYSKKVVSMTCKKVVPGEHVIAVGHPLTKIVNLASERKVTLSPTISYGFGRATHIEGLGLVKGVCHELTMPVLGGTSGGPIFNSHSEILGVVSSSLPEDGVEPPVTFATSIASFLSLKIPCAEFPDGTIKEQVTVQELAERGLISLDLGPGPQTAPHS